MADIGIIVICFDNNSQVITLESIFFCSSIKDTLLLVIWCTCILSRYSSLSWSQRAILLHYLNWTVRLTVGTTKECLLEVNIRKTDVFSRPITWIKKHWLLLLGKSMIIIPGILKAHVYFQIYIMITQIFVEKISGNALDYWIQFWNKIIKKISVTSFISRPFCRELVWHRDLVDLKFKKSAMLVWWWEFETFLYE